MNLMSDALAVLGSRHGMIFDPIGRECRILRFDTFEEAPRFGLRAGFKSKGREVFLPLCQDGSGFDLVDQRTSPCTLRWIGLDAATALKVTLLVVIPFRPRELSFSCIPVMLFQLSVERMPGPFRWKVPTDEVESVELILEFGAGAVLPAPGTLEDELEVSFTSWLRPTADMAAPRRSEDERKQRDRLVSPGSRRTGRGFRKTLAVGGEPLEVFWCAWPGPALRIDGVERSFWHAVRFGGLDAVTIWARQCGAEILENATRVDRIVQSHSMGPSLDHLLAYSLHSWLINTWLVHRDGFPWLSIWEGSCYFHSTLDVEFTQAPFYLAVWPELLRIQLTQWSERACAGEVSLGAAGAGTRFMPHDVGRYAEIGGAAYPHPMEVEESANFLILAYVDWRRTGDRRFVSENSALLAQVAAFLRATDVDGSGVPARGVANTIDDGSPAIQFGRRQVYLAIKTHAALLVAAEMLVDYAPTQIEDWRGAASRILGVVEERAWREGHYAVLLEQTGRLQDPWTGEWKDYLEVPGWDAPHIYTTNAFAVLDMVGFQIHLDPERVRSDLRLASQRCKREYGCTHTDFRAGNTARALSVTGLMAQAREPGWISMNVLRDLAAWRRGAEDRTFLDRYWEWQVLTNTQGVHLFFETFAGNNLCFYPRGVVIWGIFEAVSGVVIDRVAGLEGPKHVDSDMGVPRLWDVDWCGTNGSAL